MSKKHLSVSDEAVKKATGRDWDEWKGFLDAEGGADLNHKEIVALVGSKGGVDSGWWQQGVTVGYEKLKGDRITGETATGLFQIGVQRTLPIDHEQAWELLTSAEGASKWLGEGANLSFEEGETYRLAEGTEGEVRVIRPNQHLRITWHPKDWARHSTIQVRVTPKNDRTTISFHQEQIPGPDEREERRAHYKAALKGIKKMAT